MAKVCRHGRGDIEDLFLEVTDAAATVISSGDNESYAHPRPDALGATGKYGASGARSSSAPNKPATPTCCDDRNTSGTSQHRSSQRARSGERHRRHDRGRTGRLVAEYQRAIAVYGLITARTDGHRVVLAQKLEKPSSAREFNYHCLEPDNTGTLTYNHRTLAAPERYSACHASGETLRATARGGSPASPAHRGHTATSTIPYRWSRGGVVGRGSRAIGRRR